MKKKRRNGAEVVDIERADIGFREALGSAARCELEPVELTGDDVALRECIRRTPSRSEGSDAHHRNIPANLDQTGVGSPRSKEVHRTRRPRRLPAHHIFCLTATLSFMKWGSLIVPITNPRDLPSLVKGWDGGSGAS